MSATTVTVNRAPVLTLWAAVVARRLGFDRDEALTLGKSVAGLNAQSKGRRLGIYDAPAPAEKKGKEKPPPRGATSVPLLGREVPAIRTVDGIRATAKGKPIDPAGVRRYLEQKFGEDLAAVETAFTALARAYPPKELAAAAYGLYEEFRPAVPRGTRGWGAKGILDLDAIRDLAR